MEHIHWRQTGLKRGGAEQEFETHLLKFETYLVLRDYETEKTTGAPAPATLAPMHILIVIPFKKIKKYVFILVLHQQKEN